MSTVMTKKELIAFPQKLPNLIEHHLQGDPILQHKQLTRAILLPTKHINAISMAGPGSYLGSLDTLQGNESHNEVFESLAQKSGQCWPWDSVI